MKNYILLIFICLPFVAAKSQLKVEYSIGYGQYKMDDMKSYLTELQNSIKSQYPLDVAVIDNFPSYVTHNVGIIYQLEKHGFGTNLTYLTTAGKLAYSDYSGEIMDKLTLNAYRVGLLYRYDFYQIQCGKKTNISFFGQLSPGITLTSLKTKGHIKTGNDQKDIDDKYKLNSNLTGFSVLPQLGVNLNLLYGLGVHISAGYDFEMGSNIKHDNNAKVDWSGLRLQGGISYQLPF